MEQTSKRFKIEAHVDYLSEELEVHKEAGPDGPHFTCYLDEHRIAVLWKNTYGEWEQVWGTLDSLSVHSISVAIEEAD
ncbi:hypothetical protein [Pedobacter sp. SYP-B3415]|uniref:hypothetical protein n=1 Tax=Pedobacter sp. SYP-B3415 TaxID=2496641 RepID=UPI00101DE7D8|nr:hypothetical protein [Pedobacter sp. SYP-B3415]